MRKDQLCVCREEKGIDGIYRWLIWVRKFNTQTALAWRRRCPVGDIGYRAHVLLPHSPFTCAVSQQGQIAEPLQLARYSHRATQLSHCTQNLSLQIAVSWANSSCILRMGILGYFRIHSAFTALQWLCGLWSIKTCCPRSATWKEKSLWNMDPAFPPHGKGDQEHTGCSG